MTASDTALYNVVFAGQLAPGKDLAAVKAAFAERFSATMAKQVFGARTVTLKKKVGQEQAERYRQALAEIGMVLTLVPLETAQETSQETQAEAPPVQPEQPSAAQAEQATEKPARKLKEPAYKRAELDAAFKGDVTTPLGSGQYLRALFPVTLLTMLLPLAYLALTAFSFYSVYWIAVNGVSWIFTPGGSGYLKLVLVATGLLASALLSLFLARPFVASEKRPQPVRLDPNRERLLFYFVERITEAVGAPMPAEIHVDANANASASLNGLFSRKLTLTIGLPLLYAMNVQTIAGILAHEFGHFTQRAGMRASYVVNHTNHWFYRKAHQRDNWDELAERLNGHDSTIISLAALLAIWGSWACRHLLMWLAIGAALLTRNLSRQMELDADGYEIGLIGSAQYKRTAETLGLMNASFALAVNDLQAAFENGKLADNLPLLTLRKFAALTPAEQENIIAHIGDEDEQGSWFDTHPTDAVRLKRAAIANLPARFEHDGPARRLVVELDRLTKIATLQWYREFGLQVTPDDLQPLDAVEGASAERENLLTAREQYFGGLAGLLQPLPLLKSEEVTRLADGQLDEALEKRSAQLNQLQPQLGSLVKQLGENLDRQYNYGQALFWRRADFPIDVDAYDLKITTTDPDEIAAKLTTYRQLEQQLTGELKSGTTLLGQRLSLALERASRAGPQQRSDSNDLRNAYAALIRMNDRTKQLADCVVQIRLLHEGLQAQPDQSGWQRDYPKELANGKELANTIRHQLEQIKDPLDLQNHLANGLPQPLATDAEPDAAMVVGMADAALNRVTVAKAKIEGRMAEFALRAEQGDQQEAAQETAAATAADPEPAVPQAAPEQQAEPEPEPAPESAAASEPMQSRELEVIEFE